MDAARSPEARRLARLLGRDHAPPEWGPPDWSDAVRAQVSTVAGGLVAEALASDDVTSAPEARAFVAERLAELGDLLDGESRSLVAEEAWQQIRKRAPDRHGQKGQA